MSETRDRRESRSTGVPNAYLEFASLLHVPFDWSFSRKTITIDATALRDPTLLLGIEPCKIIDDEADYATRPGAKQAKAWDRLARAYAGASC